MSTHPFESLVQFLFFYRHSFLMLLLLSLGIGFSGQEEPFLFVLKLLSTFFLLLLTESNSFFDRQRELIDQDIVGLVRWQINTVEAVAQENKKEKEGQ